MALLCTLGIHFSLHRISERVSKVFCPLYKSGRGPVDPLRWVPDGAVEQPVRLENGRVRLLIQQELVKKGEERRVEVGREEAMTVVANLDEPVAICNSHRLPDGVRSRHAAESAQRTKPLEVGVLVGDQRAGSDQGCERVMVVGEEADVEDEVVEVRGEPDVLLDDLCRLLDDVAAVLLELGQSPAGVSARPRLLRNRQGNTLLESSRHEGTLAVTRASRNSDLLRVDVSVGGSLERVDYATKTPHPGGHGTRSRVLSVDVEEETDAPTRLVILLCHRAVRVGKHGDLRNRRVGLAWNIVSGKDTYTVRNRNTESVVCDDEGPSRARCSAVRECDW